MSSKSFGNRIMVFVLMLLVFSVLLTVYMMHIIRNSELSLLEHQKAQLNQAAYLFDQNLDQSMRKYLAEHGAKDKSKQEQISILTPVINESIKQVKKEYPEVHIGLYYSDLDVFFDGTQRFDENFSLRRKTAFETALKSGQSLTQDLGNEEGGIVEVYKPFTRNGQVEGVIRSAEYLADTGFYGKRKEVETNVYALIAIVIIMGISGAMLLFRQLVSQVKDISDGVRKMEDDLTENLPPAPGELGQIVNAVNRFAEKISELNLYNETMLAAIDDAILVVDVEGRVVIANNMAHQMFDLPENCLNMHYNEIFPEGAPFKELIGKTINQNKSLKDLQITWTNISHNIQQFLLSTATLVDSKGRLIGAVLCCRDVTERMRLEEKVHRQERLASLGKLVAGVAHEIRNPLTSISCYIQHWQNQNKPNPKALATMYREVARLDSIVDQLLYFTKPGEAKFVRQDINSLITNVLNFFNEVYHGKYNLVKDLRLNLPPVWMDPEQIERVVVNIMFNALQAMPDGGTITISTDYRDVDETVVVSINDTGCGIAREHLAHLFDPFYSTRPKGTGLGLAIAHEIIQVHGGHIEVESEVGRGTKFSFHLKTKEDV